MKLGTVLRHAMGKPGAWQDEPWDGDIVAKVDTKIFCFTGDRRIGVKAASTRDEADEWLLRYPQDAAAMPYIGRSGWNTLTIDGEIPDDEIFEAIDTSYELVVTKLPKPRRPAGWDSTH